MEGEDGYGHGAPAAVVGEGQEPEREGLLLLTVRHHQCTVT